MTVAVLTQGADASDVGGTLRNIQIALNKGDLLSLDVLSLVANAAGVTITAAQLLGGIIIRSGAAAVSDTLPTAAALVALVPGAAIGDTFDVTIQNGNSGLLTIVTGAGITLTGTTTVTNANTRKYALRFTNVTPGSEAAILYGLMASGA